MQDWDVDNAVALIRAHAHAEEQSVAEVAGDVLAGRLWKARVANFEDFGFASAGSGEEAVIPRGASPRFGPEQAPAPWLRRKTLLMLFISLFALAMACVFLAGYRAHCIEQSAVTARVDND